MLSLDHQDSVIAVKHVADKYDFGHIKQDNVPGNEELNLPTANTGVMRRPSSCDPSLVRSESGHYDLKR